MSNKRTFISILLISVLLLVLAVGSGQAQGPEPQGDVGIQAALGTAFTYQGRLTDGGNPANGTYDFQFKLYDAASGGAQVGNTLEIGDVPVSEGLFTVLLDFGSGAFDGNARWLEIGVRPGNSSGAYTTLSPRQALTAAPYALYAKGAPWSGLTDVPAGFADDVDNDTTYTAGTGLDLSGVVFSIRPTYRLPQNCANGQIAKWNGSSSSWNCGNEQGGLTLPYSGSTSAGGAAFQVIHLASSGTNYGVRGESASTDGYGVVGSATANSGTTYGVYGESRSTDGYGVYGEAPVYGVYGWASNTVGFNSGVYGESASPAGIGVFGSAPNYGVWGYAHATSGTTYGVDGKSMSTSGRGVYGEATATSGTNYGVYGRSNSTSGRGVYGYAHATSGTNYGVYGRSKSTSGYGVYGEATATSGTNYGVYGESASTSGRGVLGLATATSGTNYGVRGESASPSGRGVLGLATATSGTNYGVRGESASTSGYGVYGLASNSSGTNYGVRGVTNSASGYGVYGRNTAYSTGGPKEYAGYFEGDVNITGSLSKGGGSFKIDHPLDPENKYLYHSFVESPDMMNIYNGNVVLDANGEAWVELPEWFEALNRDFRYQLTCIGGFAPVYIAEEIAGNRFKIAGGVPGMKVSWQVTGIRQDPWANANRIPVEEDKPKEERGYYLHPELYGQPKEMGLDYQRNADLFEQVLETEPPSAGDSK